MFLINCLVGWVNLVIVYNLGGGWLMNSLNHFIKQCYFLVFFALLCSCESTSLAPVYESNWRNLRAHANTHRVTKGETLYAIAFRYDRDYRRLAILNRLAPPYTVRVGQVIQLEPVRPSHVPRGRPAALQRVAYSPSARRMQRMTYTPTFEPKVSASAFYWPLHGHVMSRYVPSQGKKGIDIAGKKGESIRAASGGVVAYAGNGLSGYGNLIIIKHDNQYLTAYGNNARNLVREGQRIKSGQVIGVIGVVDRRYWGVHFEIRKAGKPVNPLNYLQKTVRTI